MHKKSYVILLLIGICLFQISPLKAQDQTGEREWEKYDLEYRLFRFAFIPGLSTNGIDAPNYASKYSLNILGGYNGALDKGFELGSLFNGNKYYAHGVQIAGLANYSGEETVGVQIAGLGTYSDDDMRGIQISGIGNAADGNMQGIQISGIGAVANGDIQGIQVSGILNLSDGSSQGLQSAGIVNMARDGMQGLFLSGIGNISGGDLQGLSFSGVFNIARNNMQGITASGVVNYSETFQGISLSTVNISKEFQGIQFGVANIGRFGQGIQVGVINYADEFEGVPVGLISYYANGRRNIDTWTSESGFTNVGIKLGTEDVYNMISLGSNPFLGREVWQVGWSIGRLHEYRNYDLYTDFSYFKINEGNMFKGEWTNDLNSIFKYRVQFSKELSDGFRFYGGPTANMLISRVPESDDYTLYRLFDFHSKERQYVFWLGASLGIELF